MSRQTKAWAVVDEGRNVLPSTVRKTRSQSISAYGTSNGWHYAKKAGYRCVRVTITEDNRNE